MIFTIASLLMTPPSEDAWVLLSRDRQYTIYVDARSVSARAGPGRQRLRQWVDFASPSPSGTVTAEYEVEISCEARTIFLWSAIERDRNGRVTRLRKYSQPRLHSIHSNSVGDRMVDYACDRSPQARLRSVPLPHLLLGDYPLWSEIYRNREQIHYVDAGHVSVTGDRRTVWHRVDFATPRPNGALTLVYNVELSCGRRLIATLRGTERDGAGRLLRSRDNPQPGLRAIVPNSVGEAIFNYFCEPSASR